MPYLTLKLNCLQNRLSLSSFASFRPWRIHPRLFGLKLIRTLVFRPERVCAQGFRPKLLCAREFRPKPICVIDFVIH